VFPPPVMLQVLCKIYYDSTDQPERTSSRREPAADAARRSKQQSQRTLHLITTPPAAHSTQSPLAHGAEASKTAIASALPPTESATTVQIFRERREQKASSLPVLPSPLPPRSFPPRTLPLRNCVGGGVDEEACPLCKWSVRPASACFTSCLPGAVLGALACDKNLNIRRPHCFAPGLLLIAAVAAASRCAAATCCRATASAPAAVD
jgi:hypothetical protein